MPIEQSSWRISSWVTPPTQVAVDPTDSSVSPESRTKISERIEEQLPQFVREDYPDFVEFLKLYFKSAELRGGPMDVVNNFDDYYNIDKLNDLVEKTTVSSAVAIDATTIDVVNTRDFPKEGLAMINDEIIYYKSKNSTQLQHCVRGFHATTKIGTLGEYTFSDSVAAAHSFGDECVNLNNLLPLFMLGRFRDQFAEAFPTAFDSRIKQSSVTKRLKDFYAAKGTSRSFQYLMRVLYGIESEVRYPKDRIFKPSDAFYSVREVIRADALDGNPVELTGQVLYQANDPTDPLVNDARIYVKTVVEVFTEDGKIYELDVDTENGQGTFATPYKTTLSEDIGDRLDEDIVTVDSTLGWPELDGKIRIGSEVLTYTDKTVNQFLGCTRARDNTTVSSHIAGSEVISAFEIFGYSNRDGSKITLKVFGGTRGIELTDGGKYYIQDSKVTTPAAPGFDSNESIWPSFIYNTKKLLTGSQLTLSSPDAQGRVIATVTTTENHGLKRADTIRILNAPEDVYNSEFAVVGVSSAKVFDIQIPVTPNQGVSGQQFLITREFAKATSDDTSIRLKVQQTPSDVQNTYRTDDHCIVASPGIPGHKIGPFGADDLDPGNQRYLKRIPRTTKTKSTKQATPVGQIGIGTNGVPFFSYKSEDTKLFGGVKSISVVDAGDGYDITNPPIVEFEPLWKPDTNYFLGQRVRNSSGQRYKNLGSGKSAQRGTEPTHSSGNAVQDGQCLWDFEGVSAQATVSVSGRVFSVNVTNGGQDYTTAPTVAISGGNPTIQAAATATITSGRVTSITVTAEGSGYDSVPTVTITGGGGTGATAQAVVRGGLTEDGITITNAGTRYDERPNITLISGSGAVAYPSIVNGRIVSIILTYGGTNYYGPPDVVITGDGVGAVAFAQIDSSSQQVTSINVTNGGAGYTSGKTFVDIVYPGAGARFQVELPQLTINKAATADELGVDPLSYTSPKIADEGNGVSMTGANFSIYGGEYGYMYNPKILRFLLGDNVNDSYGELNPTRHSPILGWAYDGHPIYGPYAYVDKQNRNPFNQLKQMTSSYRIRSGRDSLVTGLTDTMGTYIEDFEYVEGLGDLDKYNGRFCVTPEYPEGVYAYFCTLDGTTGNPKFPYFIGPDFYSQADNINWNGNGLQSRFSEDAVRYKAPYVFTDGAVVRRKDLGDPVNYILALEDATTPIVLEQDTGGNFIGFVDVGIGYYDYFPSIRGGSTDSLFVSATNRYFSEGVNQYLIEGAGRGYKVNDRLVFTEESTGGSGISARISRITGVDVNTLNFAVNPDTDVITATIGAADTHYIKPEEFVDVFIGNNENQRDIDVKIIDNKYHFKYYDVSSFIVSSPGRVLQANLTITAGENYTNGTYNGVALSGGSGTAATANIIVSGNEVTGVTIVSQGKNYKDGDVLTASASQIGGTGTGFQMDIGVVLKTGKISQNDWTLFAGSGYTEGTYTNVPLFNSGVSSGEGALFTIVVNSSGEVSEVTVTNPGSGYVVGEQLTATNSDIGNGSGFYITPNKIIQEFTLRGTAAHQLTTGDVVVVSGTTPADYDGTHTVTGTSTGRRFQFEKAVQNIVSTGVITSTQVYNREPKLDLINGHKYKFKTEDTSNDGKRLEFTFDAENTNIFTYKNIVDTTNDTVTGQQRSITVEVKDIPGTLFYFDINGTVQGNYLSVIQDPYIGSNTVTSVTQNDISFILPREPDCAYGASAEVSYSTSSIYPSGGIASINIGDSGRNYSTLPQFTGIERSGAGAEATATISGFLEDVAILENGTGYNPAQLPQVICSMPDFVDLTLDQVFGTFSRGDIVTSERVLGGDSARGKVISWNANTSTLRVEPLRNNLTGATTRGFIMFNAANALRNKVFTGPNQATITAVSGQQAAVAAIVPATGPELGTISNIAINSGGSNYRKAPLIYIDDPYYGGVGTVSITSQNSSANFVAGTYNNVTQKSVAPTGGTDVEFTVVIDASTLDVSSVTVTNGGTTYALGDIITISGAQITGGGDGTDDFTVTITSIVPVRPAITSTTINASIDAINLTNAGSGYLSAPDVKISGGTGLNAVLRAEIVDETVSQIVIENAGSKFQNAPIISIQQGTGEGGSVLLKSENLGTIIGLGGDNITYNYSHDRTLKPEVNTTYNLQLTRTQIVDFFTVTNGGNSFVTTPTIELIGGGGSGAVLKPIIDNEVIQAIEVINPGKGYSSTPAVQAKITHSFVGLTSNSTLNFPYNTKIPTGTKVVLRELDGNLPTPLQPDIVYYAIAASIQNGLGSNQIRLATTNTNAVDNIFVTFTGPATLGSNGTSTFVLETTDLGDQITVTMIPGTFSVGEKLYQGTSTDSFSAIGEVKYWDPKGRILSVEASQGEFAKGQPVFGLQTKAFGEIHDFERALATFKVSPIATATAEFKRTTGILDLNEQRIYDSDKYQEFSYVIDSPINIRQWKNQIKSSAHPAGFKVFGNQVVSQSAFKRYRRRSFNNPSNPDPNTWYEERFGDENQSFNGTTFFTPKPSASNVGKLSKIENFVLGKPDYTAAVPTNVLVSGKQLLDVRKILTAIVEKFDKIEDRTVTLDGSDSNVVDVANDALNLTNHGFITGQKVKYAAPADRFQDARNLILGNIDYIIDQTVQALETQYPTLTDGTTPDYDRSTCARDLRLIVVAWCNDLRFGGNAFSWDAVDTYIGGVGLVGTRFGDARNLILQNKQLIAEEAVGAMLAQTSNQAFAIPGGNQVAIDDLVDVIEALAYNMAYGGNSESWDQGRDYIANTIQLAGADTQSAEMMGYALTYCTYALQNYDIPTNYTARTQVKDLTITADPAGYVSDRSADAMNLLNSNKNQIAATAYTRMVNQYPSHTFAQSQSSYESKVVETVEDIAANVSGGGNDDTWDGANFYVTGSYAQGEEGELEYMFEQARDIAILVIQNKDVSDMVGQVKDLTITDDTAPPDQPNYVKCADQVNAITTLMAIVTNAITDPINHQNVSRTEKTGGYIYSCQNVVSSLTTLVNIMTTAINSGTLSAVTRTEPVNNVYHVGGEEAETIYAIQYARDLAKQAIVNQLPFTDITITVDLGGCADVKSTIDTLSQIVWGGIDNPSSIPERNPGYYPEIAESTPIAGLDAGTDYYVIRVNDNQIKLASTKANAVGGTAVPLTGVSTASEHTLRVKFDGETTDFQMRYRGAAVTPTNKNQLMVTINGIVQNPVSYSVSGSTITFTEAPLENSVGNIIFFKRSDISSNFQLDIFGDVISSLNTTDGIYQGSGYTAGTYNGVNLINKRGNTGTGATADIVITDVLDTASHVSADRFGDARVLINNNASIIADIAVGLMNRFGTPVANRFADAATLITGNTNLIANESVERMMLDIPFEVQSSRHFDAYNTLQANRQLLANEAVHLMTTVDYPNFGGNNAAYVSDMLDLIDKISFNILHGANNEVYDITDTYYVGTTRIDGEEQETLATIAQMESLMTQAINNQTITIGGSHGFTQTIDSGITTVTGGCTNVISAMTTLIDIIETGINTDLMNHAVRTEPAAFTVPGGNVNCIDDVKDVMTALAINTKFGSNSEIYDAAAYYVNTVHLDGEEIHAKYVYREATKIAKQVINNTSVTIRGSHGITQVTDSGITSVGGGCTNVESAIDTLMNIIEVAIDTDSLSTFTRTAPTPFLSPGIGDDQCKSDTIDILRSVGVNTAFGGNHILWETLDMYFNGGHVQGEEAETQYVLEEARAMVLKAINNETFETYPDYNLTSRSQYKDPSITTVSGGCTNVVSAIDTLMDLAYAVIGQGNFNSYTRTVGQCGDGYESAPTITISGGSPTTDGDITAVLSREGFIKSIGITQAGAGYTNPPTVVIKSNSGFNATATAAVSGGAVTGVTVTYGGFGYEDVVVEIIANPADTITQTCTASAIIGKHLEALEVQKTGVNYGSVPTLAISGGNPSTAASGAIARLTGAVTSVTLQNGGSGYLNTDMLGVDPSTVGGTVKNSFQVEVGTVTFDGVQTQFAAKVGGSGYTLPANDRFFLFLNSTIQELGTSYSYTGSPSTITFTEAPLGNMDFYCFYVGQTQGMDTLEPFFDNTRKSFVLKKNEQPFSLESDSTDVIPANNLIIFLNGIYQEPEVSYILNGSILEFAEPPRAGSTCQIFIYTGSNLDIVTEDTYNALDPGDTLKIKSEGDERTLAQIASSTSLDTYEYTGLRPNVAAFTAVVVNGKVIDVIITDAGSNYEVPPVLLFNGGGGSGAFAETVIEAGSGRVIDVINLQGGSNYASAPAVQPFHPVSLERTQRNRVLSNSNFLYTTQLTASINSTDTSISVENAYFNNGQGFPNQGELLIPYWNSSASVWSTERILYSTVDYNSNVFTVTTNGRGNKRTGPSPGVGHAISIENGTYDANGFVVNVNMGGAHYLETGMERYFRFTSFGNAQFASEALDGTYRVTKTGSNTLQFTSPVALNETGQSIQILPTIRVYSLSL